MPAAAPAPSGDTFVPSGFFVFRTPLLPIGALTAFRAELALPGAADDESGALDRALAEDGARLRARLRAHVIDPVLREALFVASPSLDAAIEAWLADPASPRAHGVEAILVRYLVRAASRSTPFGLFAGTSRGDLAERTTVALAPRESWRRATRLDMHYLTALATVLEREPPLRAALRWRPSNGAFRSGDQLRYAEGRDGERDRARSYFLVSVARTPEVDATLERARSGARLGDLAGALVARDPELDPDDARAFVEQLVDSQLLVSEVAPCVTGPPPIHRIIASVASLPEGGAVAARLDAARARLELLDATPLGAAPATYRQIQDELATLPAEPELARLFQIDLFKPAPGATLGRAVLREIERVTRLLERLALRGSRSALDRFRERFASRYEGREVPLVEVLDDERGIGFSTGWSHAGEPTPLLRGIELPSDRSPPKWAFGPRERALLAAIERAAAAGSLEWRLTPSDLEALTPPSAQSARLPDAFAVLATLAAASADEASAGRFTLVEPTVTGPSGATLLGRFCHGDAEIERDVRGHLAAEEALQPDAVFAEIVHLPEGRLGNILLRPVLRGWEIPYLGRSGASPERSIPIEDLRVALSSGRIVLRSRRLGKEVVPRMTTAHDHSTAQLAVYRFLCALGAGGAQFGWSWGALGEAPFLPRVVEGKCVLSLAHWNLGRRDLEPLVKARGAARIRAVRRLREAAWLPRHVVVADGDNQLPVDLESALEVDSFVALAAQRDRLALREDYPADDQLLVQGPGGRYAQEIVVPFVRSGPALPSAKASRSFTLQRTFAPGSQWLFTKLYAGTATADDILTEIVGPLAREARQSGLATRWFFMRYLDPEFHLRVRFEGDAARLTGELLPDLHRALAPLLDDGRLTRVVLDTYQREIERYGGDRGMPLAERWFEADSDCVLGIVERLEGDAGADARWRLALRGTHLVLADLGLDLGQRLEAMRRAKQTWAKNLGATGSAFERQLSAKARTERAGVEALIGESWREDDDLAPGYELLAERSRASAPIVAELRQRERAGELTEPIQDLALSFAHMHNNRLLRSEANTQELVIYDLLARAYQAELAQAKSPRG